MDNEKTYDIEFEKEIDEIWKHSTTPIYAVARSIRLIKEALNQSNYGVQE